MLCSKTTQGFYSQDVHVVIPDDAVEISDAHYSSLIQAQERGEIIDWSGDVPKAVPAPPPSASDVIRWQIAELESQQTDRRIREAALGIDGGWLARLNDQIEVLRDQLKAAL